MHRQRHLTFVIAVAVLVNCFAPTYVQGLEAKLAGAKLPAPLYYSTAVYDGTDNVYIFGGYVMLILHSLCALSIIGVFMSNRWAIGAGSTADILCYSISLDKIEKLSFSVSNYGGLALQSNDGKSIYYIGGNNSPVWVHNFNRETNVTVRLPATLPSPVYLSGGVSINGSHFIFSGQTRTVLEFSEKSEAVKIIGELPFQDNLPVLSTAAIRNGQDSVWLFAGNEFSAANPVLLFNVTTNGVDVQVANTTTLPTLFQVPVSVRDGRNGYIIGGLGLVRESDGSYYPTNGILR
jgi:hypothetical protein